ncbi:allograft inflammatory factor [Capsaspora owczarzaki ATCC 30864]|uniref:Allograft inflammatory factor n=1 Tax=Capsaspora owczarzaki (strain ATCC 30864) TaxID=595528 RepID=A0A0D2X3N3_CAPO3|nr:allograft inflammatory factor [Capsaspora owczarzaki ATCC 30864]KJE94609.1 allograft inflammatory factor [Capsaspora owczarzaki ATCC 30864]|eukprot:XP_004346914.1 allograft inflammatory factor [Capsaspora owczarzaki ATCC 30864]
MAHQGGKAFGQLKAKQATDLDGINAEFLSSGTYEDLTEERLVEYRTKFMEYDLDHSGDIDLMELKQMMEKLGQAKTHLELKKMIAEVDLEGQGTISYRSFLTMMLGKKSSILQKILMFEEMNKEKPKPVGIARKKSLDELP